MLTSIANRTGTTRHHILHHRIDQIVRKRDDRHRYERTRIADQVDHVLMRGTRDVFVVNLQKT